METEADLPRRLTLLDATSLVIGSVIGGGIFLVPSVIARHLPSPTAILLVWLFAGVLSFFGALAFAELGAMMPATGGQYVFLREAYGSLWAFLCGWTLFMVIMSAQISSLAIGFSIYLAQFIPLSPFWLKAAALAMIAVITAINYRGAKSGALVQKILMFLKLAGLAILIVSAFASPAHSVTQPAGFANISATQVGFAMIACLLAYDGWNVVSFIAGEVHRPQRNIPLALGLGVASIAVVYLLANAAFLRILPVAEMATTERVGAVVASRTIGPIGATLVTLTILISIVGSLNGAVMTPPRIYFAQARDGLFFRRFGVVDAGSQDSWLRPHRPRHLGRSPGAYRNLRNADLIRDLFGVGFLRAYGNRIDRVALEASQAAASVPHVGIPVYDDCLCCDRGLVRHYDVGAIAGYFHLGRGVYRKRRSDLLFVALESAGEITLCRQILFWPGDRNFRSWPTPCT